MLLPLAGLLLACSAQADIKLKDSSDIAGKWKMYAEAVKIDSIEGGGRKSVDVEWDFQPDGTLQTTIVSDKQGRVTSGLQVKIKYFVENGDLKKQTSPGREKYETCTVVDKTPSDMTLKCSYFFFFKKI
jgi:hypothetical protein